MAKNGKQSKQQETKYARQAISDEDFVAGAIELGQRLTRHLAALENGEAGAVADVAAVLMRIPRQLSAAVAAPAGTPETPGAPRLSTAPWTCPWR